jgi:hypothetical protein
MGPARVQCRGLNQPDWPVCAMPQSKFQDPNTNFVTSMDLRPWQQGANAIGKLAKIARRGARYNHDRKWKQAALRYCVVKNLDKMCADDFYRHTFRRGHADAVVFQRPVRYALSWAIRCIGHNVSTGAKTFANRTTHDATRFIMTTVWRGEIISISCDRKPKSNR